MCSEIFMDYAGCLFLPSRPNVWVVAYDVHAQNSVLVVIMR